MWNVVRLGIGIYWSFVVWKPGIWKDCVVEVYYVWDCMFAGCDKIQKIGCECAMRDCLVRVMTNYLYWVGCWHCHYRSSTCFVLTWTHVFNRLHMSCGVYYLVYTRVWSIWALSGDWRGAATYTGTIFQQTQISSRYRSVVCFTVVCMMWPRRRESKSDGLAKVSRHGKLWRLHF